MVKDINELKNLILWAKEQKIRSIKIADIHFELSDLALVESFQNLEEATLNENKTTVVQKDLIDSEQTSQEEENEDLYWSTRG